MVKNRPESSQLITPVCNSLEWHDVITTILLPVKLGTVVEVKCSDGAKLNSGSSEVTCVEGNTFQSAGQQPACNKAAG